MGRWLYSVLVYLLLPLVLVQLWYRGFSDSRYRRGLAERLGYPAPAPEPGGLWVHAASVGEAIAATPVIEGLRAAFPGRALVVTTMTPTGAERIRARFADSVFCCYIPFDAPHIINRFLARVRPRILVIMETELWPNLVHGCGRQGIPVVLANARMSERSETGYARLRVLSRPLFSRLDWVAAQAGPDAQRFRRLGVAAERLTVTGSIKYDVTIDPASRESAGALRRECGLNRAVWIGASTHEGEDEQLLQAHEQLLEERPDALLILVPRHPERFESVYRAIRRRDLAVARRSRSQSPRDGSVYLADTMGELVMLFGAADVAFIGGSLIERGGHNPLEAAAWSLPVLSGPHIFNFTSVFERLESEQGMREVCDAASLTGALCELFADVEARTRMGHNARAVVAANRGAVERLVHGISERVPGSAIT